MVMIWVEFIESDPTSQIRSEDQTRSTLFTGDLVDLLRHQNRWHRLTAQRLILERQDRSMVPRLRQMLVVDEFDQARLHALYALEGLGAISDKELEIAVTDSYAGIREHGIILAEQSENGVEIIRSRLNDPDIRVVFQAVLSLGQFTTAEVADIFVDQLENRGSDRWFRLAILSSEMGGSWPFGRRLLEKEEFLKKSNEGVPEILKDICHMTGHRNEDMEISTLLQILFKEESVSKANLDSFLKVIAKGAKKI